MTATGKNAEEFQFIEVYEIEDWKHWLGKNHITEKKVGMISYKKHTGKSSISHRAAMEEAICFGWIDTTLKKLDEDRYVRFFVRRGDKANWSKNTLSYANRLLKEGRMSPQGILRYEQGLRKKPHDDGIPANPSMPDELRRALNKSKIALQEFEKFSPSRKKMFYRLILKAKSNETKNKRIRKIINLVLD